MMSARILYQITYLVQGVCFDGEYMESVNTGITHAPEALIKSWNRLTSFTYTLKTEVKVGSSDYELFDGSSLQYKKVQS